MLRRDFLKFVGVLPFVKLVNLKPLELQWYDSMYLCYIDLYTVREYGQLKLCIEAKEKMWFYVEGSQNEDMSNPCRLSPILFCGGNHAIVYNTKDLPSCVGIKATSRNYNAYFTQTKESEYQLMSLRLELNEINTPA